MCVNPLILNSQHVMLIKASWSFSCCLICPTMVVFSPLDFLRNVLAHILANIKLLNSGSHMNYEQEQMEDNDD
jgi:hypothetical protein